VTIDLHYSRTAEGIALQIDCKGSAACPIQFAPALSLRANVGGVELNGRATAFHLATNEEDQHARVQFSAPAGTSTLRVRVQNDFGVAYDASLPPLGFRSQGLRILSQSWTASRDTLTMEVAGVSSTVYQLSVWNPTQTARSRVESCWGLRTGYPRCACSFRQAIPGVTLGGRSFSIFRLSRVPGTSGEKRPHESGLDPNLDQASCGRRCRAPSQPSGSY
jgi:hypothetical protein